METPEELETAAAEAIATAMSTAMLREAESRFLGKNGLIPGLMKRLGGMAKEERPDFGQRVNGVKARVQALLDARAAALIAREREIQFEAERIDVTMPGDPPRMGCEHIVQITMNKIKRVLGGLGFEYRESPELETFKYNFSKLNYPPNHPAMDDQDTFYIDEERVGDEAGLDDVHLLRTQCTDLQGHIFEETQPPLRFFTVGRTFRNERVDSTHHHTFHQVDCFMIDEGISMAHLKGTLVTFARAMFGGAVKLRFRPDFFPFVEPGVDFAIATPKLKNGEWVELGGAGLIHPNILEAHGFDSERYSGFAFGLGVERIPMMAYGVSDLRAFLDNDLRFLQQFRAEPERDLARIG